MAIHTAVESAGAVEAGALSEVLSEDEESPPSP